VFNIFDAFIPISVTKKTFYFFVTKTTYHASIMYMNFPNDTYCIEKVIRGDTQAYSYLVEKYKKQAYTFALKLIKIPEDAEEITHDAFVKGYLSLKNFRYESKFSTWLFKIIFNIAMSKLRKKHIEIHSLDDHKFNSFELPCTENIFTTITDLEQEAIVREAVDRLPEDERTVITLFYLNDCSVRDIYEITGYSESNVKIKLFRARKKLLEMLSFLNTEKNIKTYE
jgi:RNA polymerase sigma factor (sigma-70 family)